VLICSISLNALKRYSDSNEVFRAAKKAGSKDKAIDIWIAKNNRGLANCTYLNQKMFKLIVVVSEEEKRSSIDIIPKTLPHKCMVSCVMRC
jgi:hypothetical protein